MAVGRRHVWAWVPQVLFIGSLSLVLVVLSTIDIDGDPTTINLPPIMLVASTDLKAGEHHRIERPWNLTAAPPERKSRIRQWFGRLLQLQGPGIPLALGQRQRTQLR
jgi:hypothetical protein